MKTGEIILIPFPFAEYTNRKVRPSVLICLTKDKYKDLVVASISSVVPDRLSENEILVYPDKTNSLRAKSVIKVDRMVTVKAEDMIAHIGKLGKNDLAEFKRRFKKLVDG